MAEEGAQPAPEVQIREIDADDQCRRFYLESKDFLPLTMFLQKDAKTHHKENAAKTYVCVSGKRVIGYISINCSQIKLDIPPDGLAGYYYSEYPAVKIGKLAIDSHFRGKGYAKKLVSLVVAVVKQKIMPHVGCRFVIVDSHKDAVPFYQKRGFTLLDTAENRDRKNPLMFLDVGKL